LYQERGTNMAPFFRPHRSRESAAEVEAAFLVGL
jgi:hypothetical protein